MKALKSLALVSSLGAFALLASGCATPMSEHDRSTAIGAGIGAGLGAILGNNFGSGRDERALGAAAGALIGGAFGNTTGRQTEMQNQINAVRTSQLTSTVWITNSNGSKTPVQLRMTEGGKYIGPRGEYYDSMPSEEQLKQIYGM